MQIYILLIICAVIFVPTDAKGRIILRIEKVECIVLNPAVVSNLTCRVKPVNRTATLLNISGHLIQRVDTAFVNVQLFKKTDFKYLPFLVNITENYCDIFGKNKASAYARIGVSIFSAYTNLNHKCPFLPGYFYIKDLPIDEDKIPQFWLDGHHRLDILAYEGKNKEMMLLQIYSESKQRSRLL